MVWDFYIQNSVNISGKLVTQPSPLDRQHGAKTNNKVAKLYLRGVKSAVFRGRNTKLRPMDSSDVKQL